MVSGNKNSYSVDFNCILFLRRYFQKGIMQNPIQIKPEDAFYTIFKYDELESTNNFIKNNIWRFFSIMLPALNGGVSQLLLLRLTNSALQSGD